MKLDIVIPTLNERKNLQKLLPYLRDNSPHTYTNITVVDSVLSDDSTNDICLQYDTHYIRSDKTQRSYQMNEGGLASKADAILFLHADVRPAPDFYDQIKLALSENYKAGFFSYKFDSDSWLLRINSNTTKTDGWFAGGGDQCQFFDRETFQAIGGYCYNHEIMEDFEMMERIRESDIPFKIIDSPALVSARKYEKNSYLRVNLINLLTFIKYKRNTDTADIREFYKKWLK